MASECFKEFLVRSKAEKLQKYIEENDGWQLLEDENTFSDGLEVIVRLVNLAEVTIRLAFYGISSCLHYNFGKIV